ncbi:MAG: E1 ubiquitin-activating protein uba2 [Alyxoria varia]|nr:MAG: E1 ubiquitin-activating protein uba2 [Alyxoria varia]
MARDKYIRQALGVSLSTRIKESRVLVVGAGGIGCELLKNLVCSGFGAVTIVDLDTIDLSNLNRQFLFRHEHIKRAKALVAKETAAKFNPNVRIEALHANIKDPRFNLDWYKSFDLVFNALDNLEARRYVNRMCLAADVPLIESGTTGFNGQVQVIRRGKTECYDCNPKETPKTFPVCTIRSTPSQPIHCIVWAKSYLFSEIFGTSEDDSPDLDNTQDSDNAREIESLRQEARALKRIRESMGSEDFPRKIFEKVFEEDIERLRDMEDMWKSRGKPPDPLDFEKLKGDSLGVGPGIESKDQTVWTPAENFAVFSRSLRTLSNKLEELRAQADPGNAAAVLSFDKDDKTTLDFVAATANLRSIIFGIDTKSEFEIKQMAGNIIPAIATTNAMTAGLCALQAFKVMREDYNKARMIFLTKSVDRLISAEPLRPPKSDCPVCGVAQSRLEVDLSRATLRNLVDDIVRGQLAYGEELSVSSDAGILYDPDLDDNLPKKLSDLSIKQDSFLTVVDDADDDPRVNLVFSISEKLLPEDSPAVKLPQKIEIARKPKPAPTANGETQHGEMTNGVSGTKRKRDANEVELEADIVSKRGKVMEENGPVDVDATENGGPIVLD